MTIINNDYIFENLPEIINLPIQRKGKRWILDTYMDLTKHKRRDKLVFIRSSGGGIIVIEQGGETISLFKFLLLYGNCKDERDVMDKLTSGGFSLHIDVSRVIEEKKVRYVESVYVDRLCLHEYDYEYAYMFYANNNLFKYLCSKFNESDVYGSFNKYRVGTIGNKCIFWKSDSKNRWVNDNRIEYLETGNRNKDKHAFRKFQTKDGFIGKGYFGYHLVNRGDTVCVVESEKTALICSIVYPDKVWIACSGMNQLHYINKSWQLYPDYHPDAIESWNRKGMVIEWWNDFDGVDLNEDIADCLLRNMNSI